MRRLFYLLCGFVRHAFASLTHQARAGCFLPTRALYQLPHNNNTICLRSEPILIMVFRRSRARHLPEPRLNPPTIRHQPHFNDNPTNNYWWAFWGIFSLCLSGAETGCLPSSGVCTTFVHMYLLTPFSFWYIPSMNPRFSVGKIDTCVFFFSLLFSRVGCQGEAHPCWLTQLCCVCLVKPWAFFDHATVQSVA